MSHYVGQKVMTSDGLEEITSAEFIRINSYRDADNDLCVEKVLEVKLSDTPKFQITEPELNALINAAKAEGKS